MTSCGLQPSNTPFPKEITDCGIEAEVRDMFLLNAYAPIETTVSGREMLLKPQPSNA